ncbi:MAG TPA: hypothetical protein VGF24_37340 [Vicinamibacterales bacterium]
MDEFQNSTGVRLPIETAVTAARKFLDPEDQGTEATDLPEPDPETVAAQNDQSFQQLMGLMGNVPGLSGHIG